MRLMVPIGYVAGRCWGAKRKALSALRARRARREVWQDGEIDLFTRLAELYAWRSARLILMGKYAT
jgi:hypothetical protein